MGNLLVNILSETQQNAFNQLEHSKSNILILGQAGTGKSAFINYIKSASTKRLICACPTATSAINIGGQTIHSLFQIPPRDFVPPELLKLKAKTRNILTDADVLIIDEISMVAPDLLDAIDILSRQARRNNEPFGGLQVLLIGDLFQLPPVITSSAIDFYQATYGYKNSYFFDSFAYKRADFQRINFDFVYRQSDTNLLNNLAKLRNNDLSSLEFFNNNCVCSGNIDNAVIITPFKVIAENINNIHLNQINAPEIVYNGVLTGDFPEKDTPAPTRLTLKVGALVVFVRNADKWHNGSLGIIQELSHSEIKVKLLNNNNTIVSVKPEKWKKIEYAKDVNNRLIEQEIGSFRQFPLMLGYAMTIHRAQGKTLDAVIIDMARGAFAHGQTYVALSRTRNIKDMSIKTPLKPNDVIFDSRIINFVNDANL